MRYFINWRGWNIELTEDEFKSVPDMGAEEVIALAKKKVEAEAKALQEAKEGFREAYSERYSGLAGDNPVAILAPEQRDDTRCAAW